MDGNNGLDLVSTGIIHTVSCRYTWSKKSKNKRVAEYKNCDKHICIQSGRDINVRDTVSLTVTIEMENQ